MFYSRDHVPQRFSKACLAWAWPCLCPWHTLDRGISENSGVRDTMRYLALLGDVQRSEMVEGTNDQNWWLNMSAHASCWPMIELMIELINGFPYALFLFPTHLIRYLGLRNAGEAGDLQQYPHIPTTSWIWILHTYTYIYIHTYVQISHSDPFRNWINDRPTRTEVWFLPPISGDIGDSTSIHIIPLWGRFGLEEIWGNAGNPFRELRRERPWEILQLLSLINLKSNKSIHWCGFAWKLGRPPKENVFHHVSFFIIMSGLTLPCWGRFPNAWFLKCQSLLEGYEAMRVPLELP